MSRKNLKKQTPLKKRDRVTGFLFFCAGADFELLKLNHHDYSRYQGIGAAVLLTSFFAACTFAYAMYFVFSNVLIAICIGACWGLFIFNLDRMIILGSGYSTLIRIPIVLLLALSIAVPFELRIFETEVNRELKLLRAGELKSIELAISNLYETQIKEIDDQRNSYEQKIKDVYQIYQTQLSKANSELDGTEGSKKIGEGPVYQAKKYAADQAFRDYEEVKKKYLPLIDSLNHETQRLMAEKSASIEIERSTFNYDGLIPRIRALHSAAGRTNDIYWAMLIIRLLLMVIELAPVIVKIMNKGPYERHLQAKNEEESHPKIVQSMKNRFELAIINHSYKVALKAIKRASTQALKKNKGQPDSQLHLLSNIIKLLPGTSRKFVEEVLLPKKDNAPDSIRRLSPNHDIQEAEVVPEPHISNSQNKGSNTLNRYRSLKKKKNRFDTAMRLKQPNASKSFIFQERGSWFESDRITKKFIYEENHDEFGRKAVRRDETNPDENSWRLIGEGVISLTDKSVVFLADDGSRKTINFKHIKDVKPCDKDLLCIMKTNYHTVKIHLPKGIGELLEKLQQPFEAESS